MKEFTTALKAVEADAPEEESITFKIDDHDCVCYRPTIAQLAVAMSAVGSRNDLPQRLAAVIDFFAGILDDDSVEYIEGRLLNRRDAFGLDEVTEIMEWMVEEWSARPIEPSSGSTRSRSSGGRKSTPRTTKSTSPVTASTGS